MANRGPPKASPSVDVATDAFKRAAISEPKLPTTTGRRPKPSFKLNDIHGGSGVGGGAAGAGLGAGRPSLGADALTPKRPAHNFGTPFANFQKIVYVFFLLFSISNVQSDNQATLLAL